MWFTPNRFSFTLPVILRGQPCGSLQIFFSLPSNLLGEEASFVGFWPEAPPLSGTLHKVWFDNLFDL